MPNGFAENVLTEVALPGAVAQVVESHYDPGGVVSQCESDLMVRWRLWPYKVRVRSWQAGSRLISVGRVLVMPAEVEAGAIASDQQETTNCLSLRIKSNWFEETTGHKANWKVDPQRCIDFRDVQVEHAMRRMSSEVLTPGLCTNLLLESCVMSVIGDLVRHFGKDTATQYSTDFLSDRRIHRIEEFVLNYMNGTPSLGEIAADLGIGTAYLRQVFKKSTGKSLYSFIEEVRTLKAQELLKNKTIPLKVVAHKLGFCSPSAFSLAFKKATGATPRAFRIQYS